MSFEELLDRIAVPRPGASVRLQEVAHLLEETLRNHGAEVELAPFAATPYGFQILYAFAFVTILGFAWAMLRGRYWGALVLAVIPVVAIALEMELLLSPVSGIATQIESNVLGTYPGRPGGPTLVFTAHYDSATQFGDHVTWARWSWMFGPAVVASLVGPVLGILRSRAGQTLRRKWVLGISAFVVAPYAAYAFCFAAGPLLRAPSPGALDNAGSVAVLLKTSEWLASRPRGEGATVVLAFLAGEEERALGSWHYARALAGKDDIAVVNLEILGASPELAWVAREGFMTRSYTPPPWLVGLVSDPARARWGRELAPRDLPGVMYTDARSFLAQGIPCVTLMSLTKEGPRALHSANDDRSRLRIPPLGTALRLLQDVVALVDSRPAVIRRQTQNQTRIPTTTPSASTSSPSSRARSAVSPSLRSQLTPM